MKSRFLFVAIIALTLTISACQSVGPLVLSQEDAQAASVAQAAARSGDYNNAAQQYLNLAQSSRGKTRAYFYLKAADALLNDEQYETAIDAFTKINRKKLDPADLINASLVDARLKLAQSQADQALMAVDSYSLNSLSVSQQKKLLKIRIEAYAVTENWLEKANSHIRLDSFLDGEAQEQNQQALWQALMNLTSQALDLFNPGMAPAIDSGWFSLAYIIKSYQKRPAALVVAIEDWQRNYPNHPAKPSLYQSSFSQEVEFELPQSLDSIAILLPETGPYANAAQAVKQGILAAHSASAANTQLHFIDVRTDSVSGFTNVQQAYQQALSVNADLIIGPLDKKALQDLSDNNDLAIPVLALNRLPIEQGKRNLFQFGLAPEDDALSAVNYALQEGYQRAAIILPNAEWGQRVSSTFIDQWIAKGGTLLSQAMYDESANDFSSTLTPLLGLTSSEHRYQTLKRVIGQSAEFEPRRRQDLDFIFVVARPLKARQLVPQLRFHRSGDLPIIATSHAYAGYENSQQDIDLNGLIINDIPWVYSSLARLDSAYAVLQAENPSNSFNSLVRLYALGADAYRLTNQLSSLRRSSNLGIQGATGTLSVDELGYIRRKLQAGKFKDGKIQALSMPNNVLP